MYACRIYTMLDMFLSMYMSTCMHAYIYIYICIRICIKNAACQRVPCHSAV